MATARPRGLDVDEDENRALLKTCLAVAKFLRTFPRVGATKDVRFDQERQRRVPSSFSYDYAVHGLGFAFLGCGAAHDEQQQRVRATTVHGCTGCPPLCPGRQ